MRRSLRSSRCARAFTGSGSPLVLDRRLEIPEVVVLLPELSVDGLELLLQIELALVLEQ
jgi:hypothetical protein